MLPYKHDVTLSQLSPLLREILSKKPGDSVELDASVVLANPVDPPIDLFVAVTAATNPPDQKPRKSAGIAAFARYVSPTYACTQCNKHNSTCYRSSYTDPSFNSVRCANCVKQGKPCSFDRSVFEGGNSSEVAFSKLAKLDDELARCPMVVRRNHNPHYIHAKTHQPKQQPQARRPGTKASRTEEPFTINSYATFIDYISMPSSTETVLPLYTQNYLTLPRGNEHAQWVRNVVALLGGRIVLGETVNVCPLMQGGLGTRMPLPVSIPPYGRSTNDDIPIARPNPPGFPQARPRQGSLPLPQGQPRAGRMAMASGSGTSGVGYGTEDSVDDYKEDEQQDEDEDGLHKRQKRKRAGSFASSMSDVVTGNPTPINNTNMHQRNAADKGGRAARPQARRITTMIPEDDEDAMGQDTGFRFSDPSNPTMLPQPSFDFYTQQQPQYQHVNWNNHPISTGVAAAGLHLDPTHPSYLTFKANGGGYNGGNKSFVGSYNYSNVGNHNNGASGSGGSFADPPFHHGTALNDIEKHTSSINTLASNQHLADPKIQTQTAWSHGLKPSHVPFDGSDGDDDDDDAIEDEDEDEEEEGEQYEHKMSPDQPDPHAKDDPRVDNPIPPPTRQIKPRDQNNLVGTRITHDVVPSSRRSIPGEPMDWIKFIDETIDVHRRRIEKTVVNAYDPVDRTKAKSWADTGYAAIRANLIGLVHAQNELHNQFSVTLLTESAELLLDAFSSMIVSQPAFLMACQRPLLRSMIPKTAKR